MTLRARLVSTVAYALIECRPWLRRILTRRDPVEVDQARYQAAIVIVDELLRSGIEVREKPPSPLHKTPGGD